MDPSALIFVALAVAWAVYLIPKALEHHGESDRARTVDRFSARMRVLARREPIGRRKARLVTSTAPVVEDRTASRPLPEPVPVPVPLTAVQVRAHRRAAARAARRRLRVVSVILLANVVVGALAAFHVIGWAWCAIPVGVLGAWLVACRLMVKRERAVLAPRRRMPVIPEPAPDPADTATVAAVEPVSTDNAPTSTPDDDETGSWDPVPVTLPTYVTKPVAPRSVTTIDLDSTGVWSSGHKAEDSELAREAEATARLAAPTSARRKATGS